MNITRRDLIATLLGTPTLVRAAEAPGWTPLFDGRSLKGWRASENPDSWKVVDGQLAADGPRAHLFYTGNVSGAKFRNFEFKAEYRTKTLANSGIYFHTEFQEKGFPYKGFEIQVNATAEGEGNYRERKKGGSLYGVRNVYKTFAPDDQWNETHIIVRGNQVQVRLNGVPTVDYIEPRETLFVEKSAERRLGSGTFALQCHDAGSKAFFRNIRVRPLPDDAKPENPYQPIVDEIAREWFRHGAENMPVVDFHAHLKNGWTLQQAIDHSHRTGIFYGLAVNCGIGFPVQNDAGVRDFIASLKGAPVFTAIQGEGREWPKMLSRETLAQVDYCFSDAMTFTDDRGRRMRLWIKEEVGEIEDRQRFMDMYVDKIVGVISNEPVDIYANPTFLPDVIAPAYNELWTASRMGKVIDAAKKHNVAIEINNRYRIPNEQFISLAKQAGVVFSFGTNNAGPDIGRLEYPLEMIKACDLKWRDIFYPRLGQNRSTRERY